MTPFLPGHAPSPRPRQPLVGDTECDVCVIGGGICGVLTAHLLAQSGARVVLLEARRLLSGQTRGTTAKVTVQHGLFADSLIAAVGPERARSYVKANQRALRALLSLADASGVDCSCTPESAYLYAVRDISALEREARAYETLGLKGELVTSVPTPLQATAALRVDHQAQLNPFPLLCTLSAPLTVYENTRALALEGTFVRTRRGYVYAKAVAVCSHYPAFRFPGAYFLRLYQERSYTLALRPGRDTPPLRGMFFSAESGTLSLRTACGHILAGGEGHRCGDAGSDRYTALRQKALALFPGSEEAAHWSAQDCVTLDGVPYVGPLSRMKPGVYVATGFGKWGMTNAMAAAMLLRDEIAGSGSPYAPVFSPQRPAGKTAALAAFAHARRTAAAFSQNLAPAACRAQSLAPGEAAIVGEGLHKRAAYRDESGRLHKISPYCKHMKCILQFNPDEKSWDCPCHGSRFSIDGELLCGPAQAPLKGQKKEPE